MITGWSQLFLWSDASQLLIIHVIKSMIRVDILHCFSDHSLQSCDQWSVWTVFIFSSDYNLWSSLVITTRVLWSEPENLVIILWSSCDQTCDQISDLWVYSLFSPLITTRVQVLRSELENLVINLWSTCDQSSKMIKSLSSFFLSIW